MNPTDFQSTLQRLGISQAEAARLLGVTPGAVTRWAQGARAVPGPVARLLWLMRQAETGRNVRYLLEYGDPR